MTGLLAEKCQVTPQHSLGELLDAGSVCADTFRSDGSGGAHQFILKQVERIMEVVLGARDYLFQLVDLCCRYSFTSSIDRRKDAPGLLELANISTAQRQQVDGTHHEIDLRLELIQQPAAIGVGHHRTAYPSAVILVFLRNAMSLDMYSGIVLLYNGFVVTGYLLTWKRYR